MTLDQDRPVNLGLPPLVIAKQRSERLRKLDAALVSPATVRRATLNQVWDRLLEAGDLSGAAIVMKMIHAVVDDQ